MNRDFPNYKIIIINLKKEKIYFNPILKNENTQIELRPLKPRERYVLLCQIVRRYYNFFESFFL